MTYGAEHAKIVACTCRLIFCEFVDEWLIHNTTTLPVVCTLVPLQCHLKKKFCLKIFFLNSVVQVIHWKRFEMLHQIWFYLSCSLVYKILTFEKGCVDISCPLSVSKRWQQLYVHFFKTSLWHHMTLVKRSLQK